MFSYPQDIISSGEQMVVREGVKVAVQGMLLTSHIDIMSGCFVGKCVACGYISSQKFCQACILLKTLNDGLPEIAIGEDGVIRRPRSKKITKEIAQTLNEVTLDKGASCDDGRTVSCLPHDGWWKVLKPNSLLYLFRSKRHLESEAVKVFL